MNDIDELMVAAKTLKKISEGTLQRVIDENTRLNMLVLELKTLNSDTDKVLVPKHLLEDLVHYHNMINSGPQDRYLWLRKLELCRVVDTLKAILRP